MNKLTYLLLFLSVFVTSKSQEYFEEMTPEDSVAFLLKYEMMPRYGVFYHHGINLHTSNFSALPGVPSCCPEYTFGTAPGFTFGGIYDYPLKTNLHLSGRLFYSTYDANYEEFEPTTVIIDGVSAPGEFKHRLDADFSAIGIEPLASYNVWDNLWLNGGISLAFYTSSKYSQFEQIVKPTDRGTFTNGRRVQNVFSGDIEEASSLQLGISIGASYKIPLDDRQSLFAYPEFFYRFIPTSPVSGVSWSMHTLRAGVALKYKKPLPPPPPPAPPIAPPIPAIPVTSAPPSLAADVSAVQLDSNNVENKNFNLRIEDFISLNMRPLLNYVFFDSLSSEIPQRYNRISESETNTFDIKKLEGFDALQTYYHVMNIVGKRMKQESNAKITLVGTNSGIGSEEGNLELSQNRAENVKKYLVETWGIDESRIDVKARNLPDKATRSDDVAGQEENRRVEIMSDNLKITEPVVTIDTMRVITTSTIRFKPTVQSERKIVDWKLKVENDQRTLNEYNTPKELPEQIDWKISNKDENSPQKSGNILYKLIVTNDLGQVAESQQKRLPVERITIDKKRLERIKDKEFEYYSLILFDYGKTNLQSEHRNVVDLVKDRVTSDATVYINGYTDALGDREINKKISEQRARSVAQRLNIRNAIVEGIGEDDLLYNNALPEGRFYCRTVQIIIETPSKEEELPSNDED